MKTVQHIAIDKIRVINPRGRNRAKFSEIVTNVSRIGLKRPITVKAREDVPGEFDLVCGQGRLEACIALGQTKVPAVVITVSNEDAYIMSLVENIARRAPNTLELVEQIEALRERGYSPAEIARKVGASDSYVRSLLRLYADGEERLLAAVGRGDIPVAVAAEIAVAEDKDVQRSLAAAYANGTLRGKALAKARNLVEARRTCGKRLRGKRTAPSRSGKHLTADQIVRTFQRETQRQALLVKKARLCESRLLFLATSLRVLIQDENFANLLRAEQLDKLPEYLVARAKLKAAS